MSLISLVVNILNFVHSNPFDCIWFFKFSSVIISSRHSIVESDWYIFSAISHISRGFSIQKSQLPQCVAFYMSFSSNGQVVQNCVYFLLRWCCHSCHSDFSHIKTNSWSEFSFMYFIMSLILTYWILYGVSCLPDLNLALVPASSIRIGIYS